MINKKVCIMGAFSVGKTSLVERYVHSIFSDSYLSTVGVKISKKDIMVNNIEIAMVLWDMEGKDDFSDINMTYLRGAMGFFAVADFTRKETLDAALQIRKRATELIGKSVPNILLLNKEDAAIREITDAHLAELTDSGIQFFLTSAKTGKNVESAFISLADQMML
ncbi:MAG: GTP-binding protein [Deferribacteraceae bacterium]|jgi:small GTP-binding protein|nr:GTP-binding protein [Deferribacteraceae bacterium]